MVLLWAFLYLLPSAVVRMPFFQEMVSSKVASYLENRLQTKVNIRQIDFGFFKSLILRDVYLEDLSGDSLLYARRISADFELIPILKKQWRFHSAQLFDFKLNLNKETSSAPLNIQYIIDAFSNNDSIKDNTINLKIRDLELRSGVFTYREKDKLPTKGIFNPNDFLFSDIAANIKIRNLEEDSLNIGIVRLECKEKSGLQIKKLTFDLTADKEFANIEKLQLESGLSSIYITNFHARYSDLKENKVGLKNTDIELRIENSKIYPEELKAFSPVFEQFKDYITLEGSFSGTPNDLDIENLYFRYKDSGMISANARINDTFNPSELMINCMIEESFFTVEGIERMINNFSEKETALPEKLLNLGKLTFQGSLRGKPKDLTAWGIMTSSIGALQANVTLGKDQTANFLSGKLSSEGINLEKLMDSPDYGDFVFDVNIDSHQKSAKDFWGTIDANILQFDYKGYTYYNIDADGEFSANHFKGLINMDSPEGKIAAEGLFAFEGENSQFRFSAEAREIMPDKLNLLKKSENSLLSFDINVDFSGNNFDNAIGSILLSNLVFTSPKGEFKMDKFLISSIFSGTGKDTKIRSDIINGSISGDYLYETLSQSVKRTLSRYLPSLADINTETPFSANNKLNIDLTIEDMGDMDKLFGLPFSLHKTTTITGDYNSETDDLKLNISIPEMKFGGARFENIDAFVVTKNEIANLKIAGQALQKNDNRLKFNLSSDAGGNELSTKLDWKRDIPGYEGVIDFTTDFQRDENHFLMTKTAVAQSNLVFNDTIWRLYPTSILIDKNAIRINKLQAAHQKQFIKIDGAISKNPEEKMLVELNEVNLEYIFNSLNIKSLDFGGIATGYVNVRDVYNTRELSTKLDVTDFSFNDAVFGNLDLTGTWDDENQGVLMDGIVVKNDSTDVFVKGIIYPVKEELSIDFNARNADARFLRKYLDRVAKNMSGELSGHLRLFGDLNDPTVEGNVFARNCRFGIEFLNTYYTFSDSVFCSPEEIRIKDVRLYDERGNYGIANGFVHHTRFSDFNFSAILNFDNFLVFNSTKNLNPLFFGTAYGSGQATLSGIETDINIDVSMRNTDKTKMTLNFMEEADIEDLDFIQFVTPHKNIVQKTSNSNEPIIAKTTVKPTKYTTDINLSLSLNINQQAALEIIMDPSTGDRISGSGVGNVQIQYGTKIPMKVMGNYRIESGKYNFSFQQALFRNFDINEGSSISFRGDPFSAELDITAGYRVLANIGDLDQRLLEQSNRTNIPVTCILKLTGGLNHPTIGFDMELPASTTELSQQVKSYIRTDDMMSRQIFYLLLLSRFYTPPEYASAVNTQSDISLLTATLSSQFVNLLGSNISDKLQIDSKFNYSYEGTSTKTEAELLIGSQLLNNRLIFNGNFGYVDNPMLNGNQSGLPLVGDFDIEYKLTRSGDIRLKGFNHYNYRYYSESPQMTQGLGIIFRKDFNSFRNLFGRKKD